MSRTTAISSNSPLRTAEPCQVIEGEAVQFLAGLPDLARTIHASNYLKNIRERTVAGEGPRIVIRQLQEFLTSPDATVWENSWVRFPRRLLNRTADQLFEGDLAADKRDVKGPLRADAHRYLLTEQGEEWVRPPISYLLKLTLAQVIEEFDRDAPLLVIKQVKELLRLHRRVPLRHEPPNQNHLLPSHDGMGP